MQREKRAQCAPVLGFAQKQQMRAKLIEQGHSNKLTEAHLSHAKARMLPEHVLKSEDLHKGLRVIARFKNEAYVANVVYVQESTARDSEFLSFKVHISIDQ